MKPYYQDKKRNEMAKQKHLVEEIAPRAYQKLTVEFDNGDFTIALEFENSISAPTQRIFMKGWEAKRLAMFIEKYFKPLKDTGGEPHSYRGELPERLPHHGNYPPGTPPSIGD